MRARYSAFVCEAHAVLIAWDPATRPRAEALAAARHAG